MKKNSRIFLSLLCAVGIGLNANAMKPSNTENDFMIKNLNNYKKEDFSKLKFGGYRDNSNKSNNDFIMENLNNYPKEDFGNLRFVDNKNVSNKSKPCLVGSNFGGKNSAKQDIPNINQETIKKSNLSENICNINVDEVAIKLDYPFNLLVVADNEDRMKKVTSLLCNNNLSLSLGNLKSLQDLNHYKSGGIYYAVNNPSINVLCITLDDFINNSFNYDWDFICQNTTKIFYTFGWDSGNAEKYFDTLKKFYHKFNKHWCGKDLDYDDNYDPNGKQISENDFKGPVLKKGKNDWFEYIRAKRNLFNHRYIFFLLDSDKIDYSFEFGKYVANMPDARSITLCKLKDELCIKPLINLLFSQSYEGFQKVKPFLPEEKKNGKCDGCLLV